MANNHTRVTTISRPLSTLYVVIVWRNTDGGEPEIIRDYCGVLRSFAFNLPLPQVSVGCLHSIADDGLGLGPLRMHRVECDPRAAQGRGEIPPCPNLVVYGFPTPWLSQSPGLLHEVNTYGPRVFIWSPKLHKYGMDERQIASYRPRIKEWRMSHGNSFRHDTPSSP